jgi:hypothetical protein
LKILFVCSCLEPGRDGVGDYTRRLAAELISRGHECAVLSLADHQVKVPTKCDFNETGQTVSGLRLPLQDSWPARLRQAMSFCDGFAPDWVSWQIVPYGFDRRGLSFGLGRRLREISRKYKNQIMFHEIWIGEQENSSRKNKIIGKLQKLIIKDLIKKLRPRVIHTHTPLYQHLLGTMGFHVLILPLFGNISLTSRSRTQWLKEKWPEGGPQFHAANRSSWWIFVLFGSIHPEWDAEDFWLKATDAARKAGKNCLLISIGRPGGAGERILRGLRQHEGNSWRVLNLDMQPEDDISQCLLMADFGVSTVPPENIFKSGTAVAMMEHGLPVIVTRPIFHYANCPPERLLVGMSHVIRDFDLLASGKSKAENLLPVVADQFITDLREV